MPRQSSRPTPRSTRASCASGACACAECSPRSTRRCPQPIREAILRFFDESEAWLVDVLEAGKADGTLRLDGSARDEARSIVSGLEGALLVARPFGDVSRFEATASRLVERLAAPAHA